MQPRYIFENGVMKLNPAYQVSPGQPFQSTVAKPEEALAIVSSTEQVMIATEVQTTVTSSPMVIAPTAVQAMQVMQDPDYLGRFNAPQSLDGGQMLDGLSRLFSQYEIPIGLMYKMMALSNYHLDFIIDDSGSMQGDSDVKLKEATPYLQSRFGDSRRKPMTRWQEAEDRLHILIDLLQYIPVKSIMIHFMNNRQVINLVQIGKNPNQFAAEAHKIVADAFSNFSGGGTPIYRCLKDAFDRAADNTMHYLFTDGEPSDSSTDNVARLVKHRKRPELHPLTFVSCTNNDEDVAWIKKVEGKAKFTAEVDDFKSERKEVSKRQGPAFPYSRGFWLISHLVAAINPYDLDALDEKYPLTKKTMNELMGRMLTPEEYRYYFDFHPKANIYRHMFEQFVREDIVAKQIIQPERSLVQPVAFFQPAPVAPMPQQAVVGHSGCTIAPAPGY